MSGGSIKWTRSLVGGSLVRLVCCTEQEDAMIADIGGVAQTEYQWAGRSNSGISLNRKLLAHVETLLKLASEE